MVSEVGKRGRRPRLPQGRAPAARRVRGLAAAGLLVAAAAGCLCPPKAEALLEVGYRTPRQTLATYQTYLRMDLPAREYQCFSSGFREANDLSAMTYGEGRERLFRSQPWLKLIARAEVVAEHEVSEAEHWIDLRVLRRTVRVKLVREGFFEIRAGDDLVTDAWADLAEIVAVAPRRGGSELVLRLPLDVPPDEARRATEVVAARPWKIDAFAELDAEPEGAAPTP